MTAFAHDVPGTPASAWRAHPSWRAVPGLRLGDDPYDVVRVVVVAAHPDDESLGAGGLLAAAHDAGIGVDVVVLTDGDASHPQSTTHDRRRLAEIRRGESLDAVGRLAPLATTVAPGFGDGAVAEHEDAVVRLLVELVGDGRRTLLVAPWRHDGHPDHEAAGRATAAAAVRTGAELLEYPVWFWHWAAPESARWSDLVSVELDGGQQARKQQAIAAHRSQVAALSDQPGDEVLLTPAFLEHFAGRHEVFVRQAPADAVLDDLHAHDQDPWGADQRWYELRKRRLLAAMLPRERYRRALEVGCSTGALAEQLAPRCHELVALDGSAHAVASARRRLAELGHVTVEQRQAPQWWPAGAFDLVVVSEVGYFLSPRDIDLLVERIDTSLADDGVVVLCHWRHPVAGYPLDGADVHARFGALALRPVLAEYRDRDVEILVLAHADQAPDPHS